MSIGAEAKARCEQDIKPEADPPQEKKKRQQGKLIEFSVPDPWPQAVEGADLLDEATESILRHMSMHRVDAYLVALWCAHTHVFQAFGHTPRLVITAPQPECGKSVLLSGMIANLVPKPQEADNITPAPFFRLAADQQPTFLIDEVDVWLKEDSMLPHALNNGWQRNGQVLRCEGDGYEVRAFSTHTPVSMAGINLQKKLTDATLSRSFVIELARALPGEVVEYYDQRKHRKPLNELCRKLARWTHDNLVALEESDPEMPSGVLNRKADKWRPLFSISEMAGGHWPEQVKQALLSEEGGNSLTKEMQLLEDIKGIVESEDYRPGIFTDELINELCKPEESIWKEHNFREHYPDRRRIKPKQLAHMFKDFKIQSQTIRRGEVRRKGYNTEALRSVIDRYVG
ncbi:MAG: DUF3631 domain-containing protein [Arenicellales bacterium]|jgi:hypothetical protein|nr:DUF3631 domain-containing protein [Arenicellales bacterium]